jgi:hypothetical protein
MEEAGGWAVGCIVVVVIIWFVLVALGWVFVSLTAVLGHPLFVLALIAALGAFGGTVYHQRRRPSAPVVSDDDFATLGPLRLLPLQWATLVTFTFIGVVVLYGMVVL